MTPFERHRALHGETSRHAHPDGFHVIEECEQCQLAWVLPCTIDSPGTLPHTLYHHWEILRKRHGNIIKT
jgi:hypothetical protein